MLCLQISYRYLYSLPHALAGSWGCFRWKINSTHEKRGSCTLKEAELFHSVQFCMPRTPGWMGAMQQVLWLVYAEKWSVGQMRHWNFVWWEWQTFTLPVCDTWRRHHWVQFCSQHYVKWCSFLLFPLWVVYLRNKVTHPSPSSYHFVDPWSKMLKGLYVHVYYRKCNWV